RCARAAGCVRGAPPRPAHERSRPSPRPSLPRNGSQVQSHCTRRFESRRLPPRALRSRQGAGMPKQIVDTVLPTTMVGSYPRPRWYTQQLLGRDVRVAFKEVKYEEAYHDATQVVLRDQEEAGLDIVTDGQMSYDDYVGVIGSFCWYMYERIGGFDPPRG